MRVQVFAIQGRFDGATVADVRPRPYMAIECGAGDLVVDLSEVETIDVIGLGVLVGAHRPTIARMPPSLAWGCRQTL